MCPSWCRVIWYGNSLRAWQPTPVFLPGEYHGQRSLVGNIPWGCKKLDTIEWLTHTHMWQLCPSESWEWRWNICLACGNPGCTKCAGTWTASTARVLALLVFFLASCQFFSIAPPFSHLEDSLAWGPSVVWRIRHIEGPLLWKSVPQALKGATRVGFYSVVQYIRHLMGLTLYCSAADAGSVGKERLWWWLHPLCMTQQRHLASMAAWLPATGTSHQRLLPHIPSIHLSSVNSSPSHGIAPQSLISSSQLLCLLGYLCPCPGYVWLQQGLSDSHCI